MGCGGCTGKSRYNSVETGFSSYAAHPPSFSDTPHGYSDGIASVRYFRGNPPYPHEDVGKANFRKGHYGLTVRQGSSTRISVAGWLPPEKQDEVLRHENRHVGGDDEYMARLNTQLDNSRVGEPTIMHLRVGASD